MTNRDIGILSWNLKFSTLTSNPKTFSAGLVVSESLKKFGGGSNLLNRLLFKLNFFVLVQLQLHAVRVGWSHLLLVERQERSCPVFLGRQQFQCPQLPVRHRPQLRQNYNDMQQQLDCTRSTNRCR